MNSICSKNDASVVESILRERGLWDYFVFPSVNWEAKGLRIKSVIEAMQLRPPSVLFIDDNPMNLEEAKFYVPDIQVADETIIPNLLADPRFRGKDDAKLSRLQQYKILEERSRHLVAKGGDNLSFLRESDIRVEFEFDIDQHLDRCVELVNRTNQLNFTKVRLSEDPVVARQEFASLMTDFRVRAALIRVVDRYGDYGFCGLYVGHEDGANKRLIHFAFSCRILNMGVEHWVYRHLGRPAIEVRGEVLSDLFDDTLPADWISKGIVDNETSEAHAVNVQAHGGCDLSAITHYFGAAGQVQSRFVEARAGLGIRLDCSPLAYYAAVGLTTQQARIAEGLGYRKQDFESPIFRDEGEDTIRLFSSWGDFFFPLYRHRATGLVLPLCLPGVCWDWNLIGADLEEISGTLETNEARAALQFLRTEFDLVESYFLSPEKAASNMSAICQAIPKSGSSFVLLPNTQFGLEQTSSDRRRKMEDVKSAMREAVCKHAHVTLLDMAEFIEDEAELLDANHFKRNVYHRAYRHIDAIHRARATTVEFAEAAAG